MGRMGRLTRYSPEVRERSVLLVLDQADKHSSQSAAIQSVASKIGCMPETLRKWGRQDEYDSGARSGLVTAEREREKREFKRSNEILRKASACLAQAELDRRGK